MPAPGHFKNTCDDDDDDDIHAVAIANTVTLILTF